jgi:plastocyanin
VPAAAQEEEGGPSLHELLIASANSGSPSDEIRGMWVSIRTANGTYIGSGYTPLLFPGTAGQTYGVTAAGYDGVTFARWEDGSMNSTRMITLPPAGGSGSNSTQITALYDVNNSVRGTTPLTYAPAGSGGNNTSAGQPSLTVQAMQGNETLNIWTVIEPQTGNGTLQAATNSTTVKVYAGNYQNHIFSRWGDNGSTDRVRTLTISGNMTLTAYYEPAQASIVIPPGADNPANPPYQPTELSVERGVTVVVSNTDMAPHSLTYGQGGDDPAVATAFETGLLLPGDSAHIETAKLAAGDYPFYCFVHPFMKGKLVVTEPAAEKGPSNEGGTGAEDNNNVGGGAAGGQTGGAGPEEKAITILAGASVPGHQAYDPAELSIKQGDTVTVTNNDTAPHTVTSGTGPSDPDTGKKFDTGLIAPGAKVELQGAKDLAAGDYSYYCMVHPYMKGKLVVATTG